MAILPRYGRTIAQRPHTGQRTDASIRSAGRVGHEIATGWDGAALATPPADGAPSPVGGCGDRALAAERQLPQLPAAGLGHHSGGAHLEAAEVEYEEC